MRIVIDPDALTALLMGAQIQIPESALTDFLTDDSQARDIIIHLSDEALSMAHGTMASPEAGEVH